YEEFPSAIVVDNVTNVRAGGDNDEDPFSGLESLMDYLHQMARETNAAVFGLHHVTGAYNDAAKPIPLSGVKGQITRVPEMVLTMFRPDNLCVSGVKNRGGKADPSGEDFAELSCEGGSIGIEDLPVLPGFDMQPDRRRDDEGMLAYPPPAAEGLHRLQEPPAASTQAGPPVRHLLPSRPAGTISSPQSQVLGGDLRH